MPFEPLRMNSTHKMFTEWDASSYEVMASVVVFAVALMKSHMPDLALEILLEDYWCETNTEQDALIDGMLDAAQHFMPEYDFSVANDQDSLANRS
jgi:hypothetical protein